WKIPQRGDFDSEDDYKDAMQKWRNNQSHDYLFNPRGGLTSISGDLSGVVENTARTISSASGGIIRYNPTLNKTYDELINAYSSDLADRWKEFLDKQRELDSIKLSRSFKKFQDYIQEEQGKNDSFSGIISYFAKKPADFFQFVGAFGAMTLPDAAMGISSAVLNPAIGFTYGAAREYTASFLSAFNEYIQEKGIDVSDSNALSA